eukprot:scaffold124367_cov24-Tisochrysis_lutea.AAC.3
MNSSEHEFFLDRIAREDDVVDNSAKTSRSKTCNNIAERQSRETPPPAHLLGRNEETCKSSSSLKLHKSRMREREASSTPKYLHETCERRLG